MQFRVSRGAGGIALCANLVSNFKAHGNSETVRRSPINMVWKRYEAV